MTNKAGDVELDVGVTNEPQYFRPADDTHTDVIPPENAVTQSETVLEARHVMNNPNASFESRVANAKILIKELAGTDNVDNLVELVKIEGMFRKTDQEVSCEAGSTAIRMFRKLGASEKTVRAIQSMARGNHLLEVLPSHRIEAANCITEFEIAREAKNGFARISPREIAVPKPDHATRVPKRGIH